MSEDICTCCGGMYPCSKVVAERDALSASWGNHRARIVSLEAEVQRLRGALEWYALSRHDLTDASEAFEGPEILITQLYNYGQRARLALQATESEKSNKGEVPG